MLLYGIEAEYGFNLKMYIFHTMITGRCGVTTRPTLSGIERQDDDDDANLDNILIEKPKQKIKRPALYKVLLLNDDYTPMEFVIDVLGWFFNKERDEAARIMMHIHQQGSGLCGIYTYEIAETKVRQVIDFARKNQHPLRCVMEKE